MVIFMPEKCTVIELARRGAAELRCGNSTPRIILEHEAFSQGGLFLDSCAHVRMVGCYFGRLESCTFKLS
jgi:hypothetical protein